MSLSLQRFEQLIDACGSDAQRWPSAERDAALHLLDSSPEAGKLLQQAVLLERTLDQFETPAFNQLSSRILQQALPERRAGLAERCLRWVLPPVSSSLTSWLRPAALACLPLVMGLFMGMQLQLFSDSAADLYAVDSDETELLFISLADYTEPQE